MAATLIHEYTHALGGGELDAHYQQIGFLLHIQGTTSQKWDMAQGFLRVMLGSEDPLEGQMRALQGLRRELLFRYGADEL